MQSYLTRFRISAFVLWACCLPVWLVVSKFPEFVEEHFSARLYALMTQPLALVTSFFDVPLVEAFYIFCMMLVVIVPLYIGWCYRGQRLTVLVLHTLFLGLAWTLWLSFGSLPWLLNMHRAPATEIFSVTAALSEAQIKEARAGVASRANALSDLFLKNERSGCSEFSQSPFHLGDALLEAQHKSLAAIGLSGITQARAGYFGFSQFWSGIGLAGLYVPQLAQPSISRLLPELSQAFVMAHEIAHLNGFATEDSATLAAYHTAFTADLPELEYSAVMRLLRKLQISEGLSDSVKQDLLCIHEQSKKIHRYELRRFYWRYYDKWLRFMGQKQGNKTYALGELLGLRYFYQTQMLTRTSGLLQLDE